MSRLLGYAAMQAAGCPIGRHELANHEWIMLGIVKTEQERIAMEEAKRNAGRR